MAKSKVRLDQLLVQRGLAETRGKAQALILAGSVRVAGAQRTKAGEQIAEETFFYDPAQRVPKAPAVPDREPGSQ